MKRNAIQTGVAVLALVLSACNHKSSTGAGPKPVAFGAAVVEVSGEKQFSAVGTTLSQPVVVQVNDGQQCQARSFHFAGPRAWPSIRRTDLQIPAGN